MAIGERIRWFRDRAGMKQAELGHELGINNKSADSRIGQYEIGARTPKKDAVEKLAQIFGVSDAALNVPDIDSYIGLMHTLFTVEDRYGLTITTLQGQPCLKMDINHPNYSQALADDLIAWSEVKNRLTTGIMRKEEYDHWRYCYPEDKVEEQKKALDEMRRQQVEEN